MCSAKIRASFFAPFSCKRLQFGARSVAANVKPTCRYVSLSS